MRILVVAGVVAIAFGYLTGIPVLGIILGAVAGAVYYARDVKRHPLVACRVCSGGGAEKSPVGAGASKIIRNPFGDCWCCGGKKSHPRLALRIVAPEEHKKISNGVKRAKGKL